MKTRLVIIGCGGFGKEALALLNKDLYEAVGFIGPVQSEENLLLPVLGDDDLIPRLKESGTADAAVIAVGDPERRAELFQMAQSAGLECPSIIHPSAVIMPDVPIGDGSVIFPNTTIMNFCSIGTGVLINSGSTIGHESTLGDFVSIGPGVNIAGNTRIADMAFFGIGSSCLEKLSIGRKAVIGGGGMVIHDVPDNTTVVGVPAKPK